MKKFWTECKQWKIKKIAFRSMVLGAATSGLTGLVLSKAQTDKLDRQCLKFGRVLLNGVAVRVQVDDGRGG